MKLISAAPLLIFSIFMPAIGHQHHMLAEMYEQKDAISRTVQFCSHIEPLRMGLTQDTIKKIPAIHMVGAGTSWHASHMARFFFEQICKIPASVSLASEFPYMPFFYDTNTLHLLLSQSGETTDTREAMDHIKSFGQRTLAITNVADSTMAKQASGCIHMQAGPELSVASTKVFSNQIAALYWLAHNIALQQDTISPDEMHQAQADLIHAANVLEASMDQYKAQIYQELAPRYAKYDQFFFVGRHVSYPLAMEAALKLKETSYLFTQAYPAGELRHGPIALVDEKTVTMLFSVLDEPVYKKLVTNAQAVKSCNGQLIVFAFQGQEELIRLADVAFVLPPVKPLLAPLAMTGLMQLFIYNITCQLGLPVDTPRNLSKAVIADAIPNAPQSQKTKNPASEHMPKVFYPSSTWEECTVTTPRILVCAPHPDDEIIGCGGAIAVHKQAGHHVSVVYMTSGDAGSVLYSKEELASMREQEAIEGAKVIGIDALYFLRNPDGYLTYDRANLINVINLIRHVKPDIVYIPHQHDGHKDHQIAHQIVAEAVDRASGPHFQECSGKPWKTSTVLCYEVWTPLQHITYTANITDVMPLKLEALNKHVSQIQTIKYNDAVQGLNRYRGTMAGDGGYSECFHVLKCN